MSIGMNIRKYRELCGMSQTELAKRIEVSKQTLYKYENEIITNIPSNKIEKAAEVMGITPADIMGWRKEAPEYDPDMLTLIDLYSRLSDKNKKVVLSLAKSLVE